MKRDLTKYIGSHLTAHNVDLNLDYDIENVDGIYVITFRIDFVPIENQNFFEPVVESFVSTIFDKLFKEGTYKTEVIFK